MKQGPGNGNCGDGADVWEEDTWGRDNVDSWSSSDKCMDRKSGNDVACGKFN